MPTLEFKGKHHIYAHHLTVPHRPLHVDESRSVLPDNDGEPIALTDQNLIIHGDNLHALKALLPHYGGRVKCIYIDPPYNTGNGSWIYNDNVNSPMMKQWLADNSPVDSEDLERHDKWLCMMWPRLHLLRELLADDGVIFISIDDNEAHHLRMLMDEIFCEENFVACFVWHSTKSITNPALVSASHTYNVAYAKNIQVIKGSRVDFKLPALEEGFENSDNDPRGPWKADPFEAGGERPNQMYPIENPVTGEVFLPRPGNCWKNDLNRFNELVADNRIVFGRSGKSRPQRKRFLSEAIKRGRTANTLWGELDTTAQGTNQLKAIFDAKVFPNPKPTGLIERVVALATPSSVTPGNNEVSEKSSGAALVLDSFAGSGTTAHAVLALNKQDGGNRRFILVECEDYANTITAERVRRVIKGVPSARDKQLREGLGGSFAYCTLGDPIDADSLLEGDNLPSYSDLAAYLLYTATGISAAPQDIATDRDDGFFYKTDERDYYLIYEPDREFLRSHDAALDLDRAIEIESKQRPAVVFAAAKYMGQRELTDMQITFCQLPYE